MQFSSQSQCNHRPQAQSNQSVPHPSSTSSSKLPKHMQHTFGSIPLLAFNPVLLTAEVSGVFSSNVDDLSLLSSTSMAVLLFLPLTLPGWEAFRFLVLILVFTLFDCLAFLAFSASFNAAFLAFSFAFFAFSSAFLLDSCFLSFFFSSLSLHFCSFSSNASCFLPSFSCEIAKDSALISNLAFGIDIFGAVSLI